MLCLSGFELYSRWVSLYAYWIDHKSDRTEDFMSSRAIANFWVALGLEERKIATKL